MPEYMQENLEAQPRRGRDPSGRDHRGEDLAVERFGLWLSFYPFDQEQYLTLPSTGSPRWAGRLNDDMRKAALLWTLEARLPQRARGLAVRARPRGAEEALTKITEVAAAVIERPTANSCSRSVPRASPIRLLGVPRRQDRAGEDRARRWTASSRRSWASR
jgi:hypothetical protein